MGHVNIHAHSYTSYHEQSFLRHTNDCKDTVILRHFIFQNVMKS